MDRRIRIRTNMSRIANTGRNFDFQLGGCKQMTPLCGPGLVAGEQQQRPTCWRTWTMPSSRTGIFSTPQRRDLKPGRSNPHPPPLPPPLSLASTVLFLINVADPHHVNADPDPDFYLMEIRILISISCGSGRDRVPNYQIPMFKCNEDSRGPYS